MTGVLFDSLDPDWQRVVANVRQAAERIWARPLHRYYTDHTVTHSARVIALLDGLTGGLMASSKRLSPGEVFVLLAATFLHDIGMQDERFAGGDLEAIRAGHHQVTAELIYRLAENPVQALDLGLPDDPGLLEAVALVAKGHRQVALEANDYAPLPHAGETFRLRLLAALLRLGDELDIDHRRVDLDMLKLVNPPPLSQLHWRKCYYVSGVSVKDEYVTITYRLPHDRPDYQDWLVPLVEGDARRKLSDLETILRAEGVKVGLASSQVRLMRAVQALPPEIEALARRADPQAAGAPDGQQPEAGARPLGQALTGPQAAGEAMSFERVKLANLERRLAGLVQEYQAANAQLLRSLSDVERVRLQRQLDDLEGQIAGLEEQIRQLKARLNQPARPAALPGGGGPTGPLTSAADETASLVRCLAQLEHNLGVIREKRAAFIDPRSAPPDLDEAEERTRCQIAQLQARLAELQAGGRPGG